MNASIIIPTAGRPVALKAGVESILRLSLERLETEVLVVDNNTDENLAADLRSFCGQLNGRVRYVREPSPGLTAARHRGIRESVGDVLTFVDDDVEVSGGWLEAILGAFRDPNVAMVGGPSVPKFTGTVPEWFWGFLSETPYGGWMCPWLSLLNIGKDISGINPGYVWGLNFSIRRSVIENCGGFHPDLVPAHLQRWQGDGETGLTNKVQAAGLRADYVENALVFHLCSADRLNVQYFRKRAFYQGVADSFTWLRSGHGPRPDSLPGRGGSFWKRLRAASGRLVRRTVRGPFRRSAEAMAAWAAAAEGHRAGWRFHQAEVATDPGLLAWVRRPDFADADIRDEFARSALEADATIPEAR